jgi:NADH-quinone oxidoreductase subunit C
MPNAAELAKAFHDQFPHLISAPSEFRGESSVILSNANEIVSVCTYLKNDLGFDMLLDISSVDHLGSEPRFEIVYHFYSFKHHEYLRLKTFVGEEKAELPTISSLWSGADWHEREVFDMMGIKFKDHPDLRRILMWDSYPHFPLRKEFPLAGIPTDDQRANAAPLAGGPFVTSPGEKTTVDREPRGKGETNSKV